MVGHIDFTRETRDAIFKQRLRDVLGPKAVNLFRKTLRGKSFYPARFHALKTIFIHIPKSAGTSLGEAMFNTGRTGHFEWYYYKAENPKAFETYYKFCFVREPVSRFLSAYSYLINGGKDDYDAAMGSDVAKYGGVNEFIEFGLKRDRWSRLRHFRPQSLLVCDAEGKIMVDFVGRFERFDEDCQVVAKQLDFEFTPEKVNVTKKKKTSAGELTDRSLAVLYEIYRSDFDSFDYAPPKGT